MRVNDRITVVKPPRGVMPYAIWKAQRVADLRGAIERYLDSGWSVPDKWYEELEELTGTSAEAERAYYVSKPPKAPKRFKTRRRWRLPFHYRLAITFGKNRHPVMAVAQRFACIITEAREAASAVKNFEPGGPPPHKGAGDDYPVTGEPI